MTNIVKGLTRGGVTSAVLALVLYAVVSYVPVLLIPLLVLLGIYALLLILPILRIVRTLMATLFTIGVGDFAKMFKADGTAQVFLAGC